MPLLGKIVVIKRDGTDGTEFPLTASCLFGRKLDCDIRIRLPHVSKEHCRIELNENKELILTNLSSMNPTLINGAVLQQSERLKDGDLITIIDRSFRFEYPPAPTPRKTVLSTPAKGDTVKVLQDQQVKSTPGTTEKKKTEHTTDSCLKDGSNLPSCPDQRAGDQNKATVDSTLSPFSDLCNMVKRDLANKPVWKSASLSNTPLSRPRQELEKQELEKVSSKNDKPVTPKSAQKKRRSSTAKPVEGAQTENLSEQVKTVTPVGQGDQKRCSEGINTPVPQKETPQKTPQRFTADQVAQQIAFESPSTKSPKARRSSASQTPEIQNASQNPSEPAEPEEAKVKQATRTSPRANAGKRLQVQNVLQEVVATPTSKDKGNGQASSKKHKGEDLPLPAPKRKRVSFGGQLSPELFDKRLPPNSPLRRGATPGRRSLGFSQKPLSLLRRASTIGLMGYHLEENLAESPAKNASPKQVASSAKSWKTPKTPSPAKTPKTPSPAKTPKTASPARTPKTASPARTPKTASPARTPKTASPARTPKTASPAKTPKTASPAKTLKTPSSAKALKTPSPARTPKTPSSAKALKTPSPARTPKTPSSAKALKTPSSAKRSPSPKVKTPSPKNSKTPLPSSNPSTPQFSRRLSVALVKSPSLSEESLLNTPTMRGRFSVSRISTPSPISDHGKEVKEESVPVVENPRECVTPRATPRRNSMKASSRKTPKSVLKSAINVVRSRRSGASRANLKVVSSWADIVKFGQAKPQVEDGAKKTTTKRTAVKQTKVAKPKTPAQRLKHHTSTGHADSPASIVVGKAYLRSAQLVGAAPKVVCNVTLFKKDMKMDEDLTGVSDIFKTPANSKRKSAFTKSSECLTPPLGVGETTETSVMNTPEESGEMVVSPMSVASTAKLVCYNREAVTRLLQDNQDGSLIEDMGDSGALSPSEVSTEELDMPTKDQIETKELSVSVKTPQHKPAPPECLTGVKRLMRTPKQRARPIEDLRGKLLKTPKEPKPPQEENWDGVKDLLNTPKQEEASEKDMAGLKSLKTPKDTNSPVVCAVVLNRLDKSPKDKTEEEEDLTGVKHLMKTPKQKKQAVEEDLTGIQQMMKTPKEKKQAVEEDLTGIQQMMKTPKEKKRAVDENLTGTRQMMKTPKEKKQAVEEDLTGIQQMMKTPKEKKQAVEEDLTGIQQMMKTPKEKKRAVEEDLTGIQQMMKTPKEKKQPVKEDLTGIQQMMKTPKEKKQAVVEDLTGIQQMMKTPKEKKQAVVEDLTGIQEMMKTPKEKKQPVKEDLTGTRQMMKTPKEKKQTVEEDLTGIQQMMKTPKEKKQPVKEDLTGIQQMMKTPRQKKQAVEEDLVGVKSLLQTPKEKGETVENYFGIDNLMKTPKQNRDEAVVGSTIIAEVDSVASDILPVEDTTEESEEKENICPVEDVQHDTEAAVGLQIEMEETNASCEEVEEVTSCEVITNTDKDFQEAPLETVCTSETAVEAIPPLASPKQEEQSNRSSPVKKTRRGVQVRTAQKSQKSQEPRVDLESLSGTGKGAEEETSADSAKSVPSVRGRRGKSALELLKDVPVQSPARKSTRGRIPKEEVETQKSAHASAEDEQVAPKPRRGRKAEQDVEVLQVGSVSDLKASAGVEASMKSPAPSRAKRGKKEVLSKASVEVVGVASESAEPQPQAETEVTAKSTTRARRGRTTRKEPTVAADVEETSDVKSPDAVEEVKAVVLESSKTESTAENKDSLKSATNTRKGRSTKKDLLKTSQAEESPEPTQIVVESVVKNSDVVPMPVVKSRRGRRVNPVDQAVANESDAETHAVESEPKPEASAVRSSRGARNKQLKPQVEAAANCPATETIAMAVETEEPATEPVVKNVRGSRRTKQPKAQVLDDSQEEAQDKPSTDSQTIEQSEAPAVRSTRGKRLAAVKDEPEARVKRGRYAAAVEVPPPVVKISRGRKAVAKSETLEIADGTTTVVEPVKETSNETEETPLAPADSERVGINSEEVAKRGRGRITRKAKVSTKDTSVCETEEAAPEEEPQLKSKKKEEPVVKDDPSATENKRLVHPSVKGRKGRGAKKPEEPEKENPAAEENVQPVRRGRAASSSVSQNNETAACPKRGQKRKDMGVVPEETTESLPKRKRGKEAGAEAQTDAAAPGKGRRTAAKEAEETSEVEVEAEEPPKKEEKPVRGRRKAPQEDVPPPAENPVSDKTTRRGTRGQPKADTDVASAPARRTRRK